MAAEEIEGGPHVPEEWIITLVHGTWGRGFFPDWQLWFPKWLLWLPKLVLWFLKVLLWLPKCLRGKRSGPRWFEDNSPFMKELLSRLRSPEVPTFRIERLFWSGANSIIERDQAAQDLAELLVCQRKLCRNAKQIVIAHSHGGNVALRAIEHLGTSSTKLFIVTLATPFVEIFAPHKDYRSSERSMYLASLVFFGVNVVFYALIKFAPSEDDEFMRYATPAILIMFGIFIVCSLISYRDRKFYKTRRSQTVPSDYVDELARRSSHQALKQSDAELLVLRGIDDEASLAIAAGAIGVRLSHSISGLISAAFFTIPLIALITVGLLLAAGALLFQINDYVGLSAIDALDDWVEEVLTGSTGHVTLNFENPSLYMKGYGIAISICATILGFSVASRIFICVYGREFLMRFLNAEIGVGSVPDVDGAVTVQTLVRGNSTNDRSRHRLYDDTDCAPRIVSWVTVRSNGGQIPISTDVRRQHPISH
jgi:hypothetical protein